MSIPSWNDLLPSDESIKAMSPDELKQGASAAKQNAATIAFGISAIGNLLACTASNSETGLCPDAARDIGWMLDSLGNLTARLIDTGDALEYRLNRKD